MQKFALAAKCLVIFIAALIIIGCSWYKYELSPISDNTDEIEITVEVGETWYSLGNSLREKNLIRSTSFYRIYIKLFKPSQLEAGQYYLSQNMSLDDMINALEKGTKKSKDDISVTFKEGLNMRSIAKIISDNTNNSYDSVFDKMKDTKYLDDLINNYWFLDESIKNKDLYYPLEGYLFPETYAIKKTSSVEDIFKMMLDQMDKVLTPYKDKMESNSLSIHEIMTLSSIVELEAGKSNERSLVAGVFFNRLSEGISLGSDVTAYYAYKMDDWSNGLTKDQINGCNEYNTRGTCVKGLPVGPICNPSVNSINAVLNPTTTDMLFFVADCDGKTYLTKTNKEHEAKVAELKKQGKWCDQ